MTGSLIWRKLTTIRDEVEHEIWWQLKSRSSSFWFDNWTKLGALYFIEEKVVEEEVEVKEFICNEKWMIDKLKKALSEGLVEHIIQTVNPSLCSEQMTKHGGWLVLVEHSLPDQPSII